MANFIGIHMLSDLIETDNDCFDKFKQDGDFDDSYYNNGQEDTSIQDGPYQDPYSGCHFKYKDLVRRVKQL